MTFTASDVLLKAASRIEEEGMWCQGHLFKTDEPLTDELMVERLYRLHLRVPECALGAVASSVMELLGYWDLGLHHQALNLFEEHVDSISEVFNDAPGRTAAEVAEAMRQAAL